jgi:antitoxin ParD1/3/4
MAYNAIAMPTRNVVLTPQQAAMVERLVASGRYQNASEVLRDGLRLVAARMAEEQARVEALRDAVQIGIADADEGRVRSFRSPSALERHLASLGEDAIAAASTRKRRK